MTLTNSESTGRLQRALKPELRSLVYPPTSYEETLDECRLYSSIERAHLAMLICRDLVSEELAARQFERLNELEADDFSEIVGVETPRGFYLAWENALMFDEASRGFAHIARSRNDINATLARIKTRRTVAKLLDSGLKLLDAMISAAGRFCEVATCGITHYRPAAPSSFGFQTLTWAFAVARELQATINSLEEIDCYCPMGACAQMGTTVPIESQITANLLGFDRALINSLDAVADRSYCVRALADAVSLGICESRICQDLAFQAGPLDLIRFGDELSGGSSNMPQKRNPFLLELIPAKSSVALGALTSVATTLRGTMYTNTAAAGETLKEAYRALQSTTDATTLLEAVIRGVLPQSEKMRALAEDGFVVAAAVAEKLTQTSSISFRNAHRNVGEWVNISEKSETPFATVVECESTKAGTPIDSASCSLDATLDSLNYGGGPGKLSFDSQWEIITKKLAKLVEIKSRFERRWQNAEATLKLLSPVKNAPLRSTFIRILNERFELVLPMNEGEVE